MSLGNTTSAPCGDYTLEIAKLNDLLVMIGSGMSGCSIVFTMILYGHYRHLHSRANHLFIWGILGVNLAAALNYFLCIFTVEDSSPYFSRSRCDACGFVEQIHSFAEPFLSTLFWVQIYCMVHKVDLWLFRTDGAIFTCIAGALVVGVITASVALFEGWYDQNMAAWCWIRGDILWFKIAFCWVWVLATLLSMTVALGIPLVSDTLNDTQRRLLWRRAVLGMTWVLVNTTDVCARFLRDDIASLIQAICEPLLGLLNVLAFLYSERMITFRALGLPPGSEPPYGFTAAMRYIPDKLADDFATSSLLSSPPKSASR